MFEERTSKVKAEVADIGKLRCLGFGHSAGAEEHGYECTGQSIPIYEGSDFLLTLSILSSCQVNGVSGLFSP